MRKYRVFMVTTWVMLPIILYVGLIYPWFYTIPVAASIIISWVGWVFYYNKEHEKEDQI